MAVDLEPGFFPLSEALFLDKDRLPARFFGADVFQEDDPLWKDLRGSADIIHASSFFHLFGLPKQQFIARLISNLIKPVPGTLVLGLQLAAADEAGDIPVLNEEEPTYCHTPATMQALWDGAGRESTLHEANLAWVVELKERAVPKGMKVGLLANPKLKEVFWVARTIRRLSS